MSQKYITVLKYVILEKLQKLAKLTKHVSTRQTNVPKKYIFQNNEHQADWYN